MFPAAMRGWRSTVGALVALAALPVLDAAAATPPSAAQIGRAVRNAERSRALWATVNICDTAKYPHVIGVRGADARARVRRRAADDAS